MFHRSYIPSSSHLDDNAGIEAQRQSEFENNRQNARSSSLDFELYSCNQSPSRLSQRRRSTSEATKAGCYELKTGNCNDDQKEQKVIQWFLFEGEGTISFRLSTQQPTLIGSGSECDIRFLHHYPEEDPTLSSSATATTTTPPVEKRHAVLAFEPSSNCFTVRDLNTTNGTYVNNRRLCGDHPETVSNLDVLRFGYDPTLYELRSASLSRPSAGTGASRNAGSSSGGPSSLPSTLNSYTSKSGSSAPLFSSRESDTRSIPAVDNNHSSGRGLPPKGTTTSNIGGVISASGGVGAAGAVRKTGGSPFLPRKSFLTKKNSDPGGGSSDAASRSSSSIIGGASIFSERLAQFQRRSSAHDIPSPVQPPVTPVAGFNLEKQCDKSPHQHSRPNNNVMQQGGRSGVSGVCSPSLTLDSGRGSSSAPSSPAKEMSPVQMMAAAAASASSPIGVGSGTGGSSSIGTSSSPSHNASPVFARKLSRPMEYLLGQNSPGATNEPSSFVVDPDYSAGLTSGNYTSFCSGSEPISFATSASGSCASGNGKPVARNNINSCSGFPSSDCELLQITEDFDTVDVVARKDSLEEDPANVLLVNGENNLDSLCAQQQAVGVQPQFLVGGDIMQPDLNVPNEVFGPISHAEILSRNHHHLPQSATASPYRNINAPNLCSPTQQGNNKPVLGDGYNNGTISSDNNNYPHTPRARSSSGDGGSNRSTPLSALYGTPHWWPDSPPPEENCCPPPPASSANASPFKKPFLLNNNICNRLKGISSSSSADPVKDSSLESGHSDKLITPCSPVPPFPSSLPMEETTSSGMSKSSTTTEVRKPTPMAFTIDFGGDAGSGSGGVTSEAAEAKKAAIAERLSKFAPRHRRNASTAKSDDGLVGTTTPTEPFSASSSLPTTKHTKSSSGGSSSGSNSLGRITPQHQHHQQRQSSVPLTAAESSSLSKSASLPKKLTSSAGVSASISKHPSGGSNNDSGLRSLSPDTISSTTSSSSRSRALGDSKSAPSSARKTNNILNSATAENNSVSSMGRKSGAANKQGGSRGGTPVNRKAPSDNLRSNYQHGGNKADNANAKLNDLSKGPTKAPTPVPASPADKEDTASEAGTYTVEKETPDVLSARTNIEQVFGLSGEEEVNKENNLETAMMRASSADGDKSFVVGGAEPGTRDWVREWAELAAQQHQQKKHQRPELPDSQYFLRETETLVSAIQERVSKHMKSGGSASLGGGAVSDSDEDEPTLSHHTPVKSQSQHSTPTNTGKRRPNSRTSPFHREASVLSDSGYAIGYQSDSSNEGSSAPTSTTHQQTRARGSELLSHPHGIVSNKMNRAFNIRRGRAFGYESTLSTEPLLVMNNQQSTTTLPLNNTRGISPKPPKHQVNSLSKCNNVGANNSSSSPHFARNDGGRFSLRMAKSRTPPSQMPPPAPRQNMYSGVGSGEPHGRAMQNGHKSDSREHSVSSSGGGGGGNARGKYTINGKVLNNGANKKNTPGNRSNSTLTAKEVELANWKRRKNYDPMKAAAEGKKGNKKNEVSSVAEGGVEENAPLPTIASPQVNRREAMLTKSLSFHQESFSPKCPSEDEDMIYIVDEMDSSNSNSPNHLGSVGGGGAMAMTRSYHEDVMYYGMSGSTTASMRPKNKLEALDNLVIATIHSLSNKVRTSSRHLLEKLQTQHANDENGALIEEMVSQLKELEVPSNSASPNKSPSRELSGTLKNLKKLEQVVLVLDKVLCDGFESDVNG